jgi:hypothetical protein
LHGARQNRLPADRVRAPLDGAARQQIYLAAEQLPKLLLHRDVVQEAPPCSGTKRHQQISITVRPEVVAQHGAEQLQAIDLPALAERRDLTFVESETRGYR